MDKVKIGIIGCGNISDIYLKNLTQMFNNTIVTACADMVYERAQKKAEIYNIPKAYTVDELLSDDEIKIVINLTIPGAHADVNMAALNSGKNVYVEKPLAVSLEDGKKVLEIADRNGLLVGCAPDTFLGAGLQTCRKLIDDGWIGQPVAATAFMLCHGHESWHPDPEFYYKVGGGPMFDMGPYYLTALISLLGPIKRVTGSCNISFPQRSITSQPKFGQIINVDVPTHITGILDFENGAVGTIITSFDVWGSQLPRIEIYGSEGTLIAPDPNTFGGTILLKRKNSTEWQEIPHSHVYSENSRGIGVADMASSLLSHRKHRANGEMAYHVLEAMHGFHIASDSGKHYQMSSSCMLPSILPLSLEIGMVD